MTGKNNKIKDNVFDEDSFLSILEDMESDKREMNRQRAAILNILEDAYEAQENIKEANKDLENRQKELEAIAELSKRLSTKIDIDEIMETVYEYVKKFIDFNCLSFYIYADKKNSKTISHFFNKKIGENILNKFWNSAIDSISKYDKQEKREDIEKSFKESFKKDRRMIVAKDNEDKYELKIFKLSSGGLVLGFVCLLAEKNDFFEDSLRALDTIMSAASVSISGVRAQSVSEHSKTESLIYSLSNGVVMYDDALRVVLVNPAANIFTGARSDGTGMEDFLKSFGENREDLNFYLNKAIKKGEYSHIDVINIDDSFFEIFINPVVDTTNKRFGAALIIHDITQIKLIDKMKTEFVSVASHQLRTPLTAIKLFTEMLVRKDVGELNNDQEEYLNNIYESTERMVRLVNDLLNVTRIESGRLGITPEPTDLNKFLKNIIAEAKPLAKTNKAVITYNCVGKIPIVNLDVNLVRQVFHNLSTNAIRYSRPKNGKIEIVLKKDGSKNILVSVRDNGIGIPANFQKRIFEKFYRADNAIKVATEGTGLGLYVSKMIIEQSGGKIWFESKAGKGTTFYVKLPVRGMKKIEGEKGLAIS